MDPMLNFKQSVYDKILLEYPNCVIDDIKSKNENIVLRLSLQNKDEAETFKRYLSTAMKIDWIVYNCKPQCNR